MLFVLHVGDSDSTTAKKKGYTLSSSSFCNKNDTMVHSWMNALTAHVSLIPRVPFNWKGVWERDCASIGGGSGNETMLRDYGSGNETVHMYAASNCESVNTHSQENT